MTAASKTDKAKRAANLSFSGHETFVFRYGWLKKAVDAAKADPSVFNRADAIVTLGVGKNMVRSIRHWALAAGVLEEAPKSRGRRRPTGLGLGLLLFGPGGVDPYLEDPNSLWLLHWRIASNEEKCASWHWAFNLLPSVEFTRESLMRTFTGEIDRRQASPPSENSLKRDIDALIRTYVPSPASKQRVIEDTLDCPLVELQLVDHAAGSDVFELRRGTRAGVSDELFAFALEEFWRSRAPGQETLSFSEIVYGPGSPGNVFKMDELALADRLERLEAITQGALTYAETAGLKQVYRKETVPPLSHLQRYYERTGMFVN